MLQRRLAFILLGFSLAACGDPLKRVSKLSEVDLPEVVTIVEALPAEVETSDNTGFFKRLMRKRNLELESAQDAAMVDGDVAAAMEQVAAEKTAESIRFEPAKRRQFWLFGRKPANDAPAQAIVLTEDGVDGPTVDATPTQVDVWVAVKTGDELVEPKKRAGIFGFLRPKPDSVPDSATVPEVQLASLGRVSTTIQPPLSDPVVQPEPGVTETPPPAQKGLFAPRRRAAKLTGPDARDVPFGTRLAFGELARVCGVPNRNLGSEVAKFPERRPTYHLYDSAPGNVTPRSFYVTGFSDGCARQFTAALALFGSPVMHEQLRYGRPDATQPYSATDRAYEQVKSRICRVGRKKPCGGKIQLLEKDTVFLSIYERFGGNAEWSNLLLHNGQVMASARVGG